MNAKNIGKALGKKIFDWAKSIDDSNVKKAVCDNALITGGALVSLLTGEEPNDYDVYFRTKESCAMVAEYYAKIWNEGPGHTTKVLIKEESDRVVSYVKSVGIAEEGVEEGAVSDVTEPGVVSVPEDPEKPKYRPRFFSTNAITLSNGIQLVTRFFGEVEDIHKNYDFVHCTCSYDFSKNKVDLPARALEAIVNKELYYVGSKYPLCSIIRTRKFLARGWTINAGQYLKMCLQLNDLKLKDMRVFSEQLAGVDSAYFAHAINMIEERMKNTPDLVIDNTYLFEVINRIF